MEIEILTNLLPKENHLKSILELIRESDEIIFASPFLSDDLNWLFEIFKDKPMNSVHLITTVSAGSVDQIQKIRAITKILEIKRFKDKLSRIEISFNNKLHGKVYLFRSKGKAFAGIISSANLTRNGLIFNHEWGVKVTNPSILIEVENSLLGTIDFLNVPISKIMEMASQAESFVLDNKVLEPNNQEISLDLVSILGTSSKLEKYISKSRNIWLKPLGASDDPVTPTWRFQETERLHFANQEPIGVKVNDLIICYGVGAKVLLGVYQVTSTAKHLSDFEINQRPRFKRWPWFVEASSLTPKFGIEWSNHMLKIKDLGLIFLKNYPNMLITKKSRSLGGLNYGKDKLRLSEEFGKYLMEIIFKLENR